MRPTRVIQTNFAPVEIHINEKTGETIELSNPLTFDLNDSTEGERIETKVERIMNNKEPITDGAPPIYTERKDGVIPEYDIRTDKWDMAIDMTNTITERALQARKSRQEDRTKANSKEDNNPKGPEGTPAGNDKTAEPKK